jgi:hypothetical protein
VKYNGPDGSSLLGHDEANFDWYPYIENVGDNNENLLSNARRALHDVLPEFRLWGDADCGVGRNDRFCNSTIDATVDWSSGWGD